MKPFDLNRFKSRRPNPEPPKIVHVVEDGKTYSIRNGERFEIKTLNPDSTPPKTKRETFKPKFAQVPAHWIEALERNS